MQRIAHLAEMDIVPTYAAYCPPGWNENVEDVDGCDEGMAGQVLHVEGVEPGRVHEAPVDEGGEEGEGGVDVGDGPEEPVWEGEGGAALRIAVQHSRLVLPCTPMEEG